MSKALILAAHPDDDILGCGGLMAKLREEVEFRVVFLCEGSTCRFEDWKGGEALREVEIRNGYGEAALQFLGVTSYCFYNLPCGRLDQVPLIEVNKRIEREIREFRPDTVFTHAGSDSNKDHQKVFDSTIIATRPGCGVDTVYSYEVLSSSEWGFQEGFSPNVFCALEERHVDDKYKALEFYESEIRESPFPRCRKGVFSLASRRGLQSGSEFAEGFRLVRGSI